MPILGSKLELDRCPHCCVHRPTLQMQWNGQTNNYLNQRSRFWAAYACASCGGVVIAAAGQTNQATTEIYPEPPDVPMTIPQPARTYLMQALASLHAPAGAVMLAASAVDAMLKEKGYREGSLNSRINKAASDHAITTDMAAWAHEVRLDANDQRHADEGAALPAEEDAKRTLDFAQALGTLLFVLPERVKRRLSAAKQGGQGRPADG